MRHPRLRIAPSTVTAAGVLALAAAGCGWTGASDQPLPAGAPGPVASQPADSPDDALAAADGTATTPSPSPSQLQPTATPQVEGEPHTPATLDLDSDPEHVDTDDLDDGDDPEHLAMFPTVEPTPTDLPTEHEDIHEHARDLPWPEVEIADPDDPYPIKPPDPHDADLTDAQQVAEAFACNWWATPEDTGSDYRNDTVGHLVTGQLADDLAMMSGAGTRQGEWYEAELLHAEATVLQPVDGGQRFWVVCHTRTFLGGEFDTVIYQRPMHVQTVPAPDDDGEWRVETFEVDTYVEWSPEETPPDL